MELQNFFAQDVNGNIVPGALCSLFLPGTTTLATGLQDINNVPLSNPFSADGNALVQFRAPNGAYDLNIVAGPVNNTLRITCADNLQALSELVSFLGPYASAPTLRNDGTPLQLGDRYFNTVDEAEYLYKSTGWEVNDSLAAIAILADPNNPSGGATGVGWDGDQLSEQMDQAKKMAGYTDLRSYTGTATGVFLTQSGIAGFFLRLAPGSYTDDGGITILDGLGRAWRRSITSEVFDSWFGTVGDGVADDFVPLSNMFSFCRATRVKGYMAAKTFLTSQPLDFAGCDLEGVLSGFNNVNGTRIKGTGANHILVQGSTGASVITYSLKNLALLTGNTALKMSYSAHCRLENIFITDCVSGIEAGQAGVLGPLWCTFKNVRVRVTTGLALNVQGTDFANANIFDTCYFYSEGLCARFGTSGGIGATANKCINTEFAGLAIGVELLRTKSTSFDGCYFETEGPCIHINAQSLDISMSHCVYGTLKNSNASGIPAFIWHESGTCSISTEGGYIFLNAGADYDNLRFIQSSLPANLTVKMLDPPSREIAASGFATFATGLPTNTSTLNYQSAYTPVWSTTGTAPVLGDGTLTGSYTLSGKSCTVELTFTAGSTTTFGTGQFMFTLPFPEAAGTPERANGIARLSDTGTAFYVGVTEASSGSAQFVIYSNATANLVQSNSPFTWASGDSLRVTMTYEI